MSITVSNEFKALWQKKNGLIERRRIAYKRRYYNGSAFVNETNWSYLYEKDFVGWGSIPRDTDSPLENVYRTSIVTVLVNNELNQWVQSDAGTSFFAADSVATSGYKLKKTLLQLQVGYTLAAGTVEWIAVFTGFIIDEKLSSDGVAQVILASKSSLLLEKSDAGEVSTTFTLEDCIPATGDGSDVTFETTSTGVDHITDFQVNAVSQDPGTDYDVSHVNEISGPVENGRALITTEVAPTAGHTVKASGVKWYQNQTIEDLIGLLCDEAGIATAEQLIDPATLPGAAAGSHTIDSQANFEDDFSSTNMDTTYEPGSIRKKWLEVLDFDINSDFGSLIQDTGTWELVITTNAADDGGQIQFLLDSSNYYGAGLEGRGYRFGATGSSYFLSRLDGNNTSVNLIVNLLSNSGANTWRVTRTSSGLFSIYKNGSFLTSITDNTYASGQYFASTGTGGFSKTNISSLYYTHSVEASEAATDATMAVVYHVDLLSVPTAMGIIEITRELNSGTMTVQTAGAVDSGGSPGTFDALVTISENGQMNHTPKQWLKISITLANATHESPVISKIIANFYTQTIVISLAIFSGMTCADAVQRLTSLVDFVTGDNNEGARFFRAKDNDAEPVVTLTQENAIIDVLEYKSGMDNIINVGRVKFGNFLETYSAADSGEASPTSELEHGRNLPPGGQLDLTGFLVANDVNIAAARAQLLYERNYLPKKKLRLSIWVVPWLEPGDKVTVELVDHPIVNHVAAHDPLLSAKSRFLSAGSPGNSLANSLVMKVLEYKPNFDEGTAEVYLEEVL